ncbi:MAG: acyl carrier protein [Candidatus Omnitrophota bacterium]|jgi:acyl carrier protein|nr:MAG: acyl carrier protein [Candidatus Omnitrophota bacterium]
MSPYNETTFLKVSSIISEQLGVDKDKVKIDSDLTEELGMDSLDSVELVMALEEAYGIEIPDEDAEKIRKVSDILDYLIKRKIQ